MLRKVVFLVFVFISLTIPAIAADSLLVRKHDENAGLSFGLDSDFSSRFLHTGMSYKGGIVSQSTHWLKTLDDFYISYSQSEVTDYFNFRIVKCWIEI